MMDIKKMEMKRYETFLYIFEGNSNLFDCNIQGYRLTKPEKEDVAEHIVKCWNSYESNQQTIKDLVALLKMAKCPDCDGSGMIITKTGDKQYVSRDMAIDAGDRTLEGSLYQDEQFEYSQCQWCGETNAAIAAAEKEIEK